MPDGNHHHHFPTNSAEFLDAGNHLTRLIMLYRNVEYIGRRVAPHARRWIEEFKRDFKKGRDEELRRQEARRQSREAH